MATLSWDTPQGRADHRLGVVVRIGRSPGCDVRLSDPGVSSSHARIVFTRGAWILEDTSSTNGTFVNGEREDRHELRDGDVIRLGSAEMTFHTARPKPAVSRTQKLVEGVRLTGGRAGPVSDDAFRGGAAYRRVSAIDSTRFWRSAELRAAEDPQQLRRRLRASYEIARATAATLDPSEILDRVLTALFEIFEAAERAFIVIADPDGGELSTAATKWRGKRETVDLGISRTALDEAMQARQALLCRDAAADERFANVQSIMASGIRSMMIAPLVFRDEVLGAVHVDSVTGVREFTDSDLELLSVAANEVAGCQAQARLHEKAVASERLAPVGQALAGLTHCIKNILQGMKGGAFILDRGLQKGDLKRVQSGWGMVRRNNAFMEELVYDLLTYSKPREPEYAPVELNALCDDVCKLAAERARAKNVPLDFAPDPSVGTVDLDPKGIRRCALNLVMNAIDACEGHDGAVTVRTKAPADDGLACILIRDTGCGMSPDTVGRLFTAFFSTKGSKGTGLGLPVTRKIVEEHGGRIDVDSEKGRGTTFTICLPVSHAATGEQE